jgi:acetyltransferase-like isoleucine patch superfamily enzyme
VSGLCDRVAYEYRMTLISRLMRFWDYSFYEKVESLSELYWSAKTRFYYARFFGRVGKNSKLLNPMRLRNVENIFVGDGVMINKFAFLLTLPLPGQSAPRLVIGDGCAIGHMNHITCVDEVIIGKRVLTADRVHISDNSHVFAHPSIPVADQGVIGKGKVYVGDGSWIGENASILSCRIGRNCVIGSNAVVISDIPDHCVAVGIPARVVRQFDPVTNEWKKVQRKDEAVEGSEREDRS